MVVELKLGNGQWSSCMAERLPAELGDTIKGHEKRPTITGLALENVTVAKYDHTGECTHAAVDLGADLAPRPKASDATCTLS